MSLASQPMLRITAVHLAGRRRDLTGITALRWEGNAGPEECSVGDLIGWISRHPGHAYVQWPTGVRGPVKTDTAGGSVVRSPRT
jgi:hypothetical protein